MKNSILNNSIANNAPNASGIGLLAKNRQSAPQFPQGQVINAMVMVKSTFTATLRESASGFMFELPAAGIKGETGDTLSFEVVSNSKNGLTLRQLEQDNTRFMKEMSKQAGMAGLKDLMEKAEFVERDVPAADPKAMAERAMDKKQTERNAMQKLRRQAAYASDNAARAAVKALLAEGVKVTKLEIGALSGMLAAIRKEPGLELPPAYETDGRMSEMDLPGTRRNIALIEETARKIEAVKELGRDGILMFIKNNENAPEGITLDTLYTYAMAGAGKTAGPEVSVPLSEIERVFEQENIGLSPENLETAGLFLRAGIALNKENFDKFGFLMELRDMDAGELLRKAVFAAKSADSPLTADIYDPAEKLDHDEYEKLFRRVNIIKAEHIDLALTRSMPLTVRVLSVLAESMPAETVPEINITGEISERAAAARLELKEIQLKLTYEAANSLYAKHIRVDVLTLTEAVDALRAGEREMYKNRLAAVGAEVTDENAARAQETVSAARGLKDLPDAAIGDIITGRVAFTMRGLSAYRAAGADAVAARFAPFEAVPRARYGDVLPQTAERFGRLLESLDISATDANIRAAKIAAANNMAIDYENILNVKAVDAKLTDAADTLHPMIAAQMVKDGFNPLDKTIDDVLQYIKGFNGMYGEDAGERLAEHIYDMDRRQNLDPGEREAMMAVYKALHIIRKNGAPAVGAAVRTGAPLTIGRLLELAETFNKGVNISAGDGEGLSYRATTGSVIRDILDKIEVPADNAEFIGMRLVDGLAGNASPVTLHEAFKTGNANDVDIEKLLEHVERVEHIDQIEQITKLSQEITRLEDSPASLLKELQDAGVPLTVPNIMVYKKVSGGRLFAGQSNETGNESVKGALEEAADDTGLEKVADRGLDGYINDVYDALTEASGGDITDLERVNEMTRALRLLYNTAGVSRRGYYLPVKLNGRLADVNMYVTAGGIETKENVSIAMLLHSAAGEMRIRVDMRDGGFDAGLALEGSDEGYSEELAETLEGIVSQAEFTPDYEITALGKLPEHIRRVASGALRFAERLEIQLVQNNNAERNGIK
ncbi:MAG: DUF6240 domain-containing protein [Defluviitaleaceae bacterium]|nr:DUF6240 domain-containing protein [Defluviitaleaceae bacterium]MCL2836886.1 DUF6240 domain-containing protein [Defluviitaleaceae bacterium]